MAIESLHLSPEELTDVEAVSSPDDEKGFWRRQFQQQPTKKQTVFDWSYGVVIPLICVAADPIVFTEQGLMEAYRPFAYLISSASIWRWLRGSYGGRGFDGWPRRWLDSLSRAALFH